MPRSVDREGGTGVDGERARAAEAVGPMPLFAAAAVAGSLLAEWAVPDPLRRLVDTGGVPRPWIGTVGLLLGAVLAVTVAVVAAGRAGRGGRAGRVRRASRTPRVGRVARADRSDVRGPDATTVALGLVGVVAVLLVAAAATAVRLETSAHGRLPQLAAAGGLATMDVEVVREPRPIARGWHVVLRVHTVDGVATGERAATLVAVAHDAAVDVDATGPGRPAAAAGGGPPPPVLGSRWRVRASARPVPAGGYGRWLDRQHVAVVLDVARWEPSGDPGPLAAASETLRSRVRDAATRHLDDRRGGLLVGFVTGDTRLLPDELREAMRATSLTHLTAVSGANVAIVAGGVLACAAAAGFGARGRRRSVVVAIAWFAFVTRFEPSVLRAGTMAGVLLLAGARGVARDPRHALAAAVLVLVLVDPRLAGSLGLLLSATATAGVLVLAPIVQARLPRRLTRRVAELAAITIGAQIAVVPLLLGTFGDVALASVPANLVAVPAAAVAATLAFVGSALTVVHPPLAAVLFALAGPPAGVVVWAAETFQHVGGRVDATRPVTVVALVAGIGWLLLPPGGWRRRAAVTAVVATVLAAVPLVVGGVPSSSLRLTAIDVGQGDAFLVESPGARILVDAGDDATAATWLRANGRRHLDLVVVTHPHLDHVGGVPEVLRRVRVDAVWSNPLPTPLPQAVEVMVVAADRGVPVRTPVAGDVAQVGDLLVEVLHPPPGRPYRTSRSELNDTSYVVRVHHGDTRVLLTGDVEVPAQRDLLATRRDSLRAELLTVPHHGAGTTDPAFLRAVAPSDAVISAGRDNRHGHPHPATVALLDELGVAVHRTDLDGTVEIRARSGSGGLLPPTGEDRSIAPASPPIGSADAFRAALRPAPRRLRRPAAAAGTRTPPGGAAPRRPGTRRRHARRLGARAPP